MIPIGYIASTPCRCGASCHPGEPQACARRPPDRRRPAGRSRQPRRMPADGRDPGPRPEVPAPRSQPTTGPAQSQRPGPSAQVPASRVPAQVPPPRSLRPGPSAQVPAPRSLRPGPSAQVPTRGHKARGWGLGRIARVPRSATADAPRTSGSRALPGPRSRRRFPDHGGRGRSPDHGGRGRFQDLGVAGAPGPRRPRALPGPRSRGRFPDHGGRGRFPDLAGCGRRARAVERPATDGEHAGTAVLRCQRPFAPNPWAFRRTSGVLPTERLCDRPSPRVPPGPPHRRVRSTVQTHPPIRSTSSGLRQCPDRIPIRQQNNRQIHLTV